MTEERRCVVQLRISQWQKDRWSERAAELGMSLSDWIREKCIVGKVEQDAESFAGSIPGVKRASELKPTKRPADVVSPSVPRVPGKPAPMSERLREIREK